MHRLPLPAIEKPHDFAAFSLPHFFTAKDKTRSINSGAKKAYYIQVYVPGRPPRSPPQSAIRHTRLITIASRQSASRYLRSCLICLYDAFDDYLATRGALARDEAASRGARRSIYLERGRA